MNSKTKNILKYWRNTLADAARVEIELKKVIHLSDAKIDFEKGAVDPQQAWQLITNQENKINGAKGIESKEHEGWERLDQIPVLISMFTVTPIPEFVVSLPSVLASQQITLRLTNRLHQLACKGFTPSGMIRYLSIPSPMLGAHIVFMPAAGEVLN